MRTFVVTMTDGEEKRIQADEVIAPIHNAAVLTFVTDNRPVAIVNTANVRMVVAHGDQKPVSVTTEELFATNP